MQFRIRRFAILTNAEESRTRHIGEEPVEVKNVLSLLKPNVASLGYALFLAINAAGVWGGVFPFLPAEFQTREILLGFFLAQSLIFMLSFLASAVGVYFLPGPTRQFLVRLTSAPYALGWVCLIAAIYLSDHALVLVVCGGALLGLGSAGFYMLWQRLFASQDPDTGNRDLAVGTAWAALMYFSLYLIPRAITAFLIPLVFLPLFGLCVTLRSREINLDQPMFEDVPGEHPHVYRQIIRDYWRIALLVGIIGFCTGVMRALTIADMQAGSLVNILSMGSMMIAAIALLLAWNLRNIRLNIGIIYKMAFPFLITSFLLLPLLPTAYSRWLAAILYAVYSVAIALMMVQCAQISRDRGVNPVFVYGFFGTIVYALHDVGFIGGTLAENMTVIGLSPLAMVALVAVYLLALIHFVGAGGFGAALKSTDGIELMALTKGAGDKRTMTMVALVAVYLLALIHFVGAGGFGAALKSTDGIELMALTKGAGDKRTMTRKVVRRRSPSPQTPDGALEGTAIAASVGGRSATNGNPGIACEAPEQDASMFADRVSAQTEIVRERYRLTAREAEIAELIARGNTVARIAEMLVVSENTVRTHSKRIYTKLDIHKKQELIDLIDSIEEA